LWVRPGRGITAVARAAEILIRARAFALLVIDLPRGAKLTRGLAQRLRTSASQTNTSLIILCERAGDVEQAQTRLQASQHRGETSLLLHKGSAAGGFKSVTASFDRRRPIAAPAAPVAAAIDRIDPGNEPPGAQIPPPPIFPAALPVHRQRAASPAPSTQSPSQAVQGAI
jgi:hypothetical protein